MVVVTRERALHSRIGVCGLPAKRRAVAAFSKHHAAITELAVSDGRQEFGEIVDPAPKRLVLTDIAEELRRVVVRHIRGVLTAAVVFEALLIPSPRNAGFVPSG